MEQDKVALILHELKEKPEISQRLLAKKFQISLGKVNFVLKELSRKGYIKINKFIDEDNKLKYRYILTPEGFQEKVRITKEFIKKKIEEYEKLLEDVDGINRG